MPKNKRKKMGRTTPARVAFKKSEIEMNGEKTYLLVTYEISNLKKIDEHAEFSQKLFQKGLECDLVDTDVDLIVYGLSEQVYLDKTIVLDSNP